MAIVLDTFDDLIDALETNREARRRLKYVLYDLDLEESIRELRRGQDELRRGQGELRQDVSELRQDVSELRQDVSELQHGQAVLRHDVAEVKGTAYEYNFARRAAGIFGRIVLRGKDGTNDVLDHLNNSDTISEYEFEQVSAADLIWIGKQRKSSHQLVLVVEASWRVEEHDINRASERASIVQRSGLQALPVVAGKRWEPEILASAKRQGVIIVDNFKVENGSIPSNTSR